jgi:hypothetical protein
MAHYAKLDENNMVIEVIVIANGDCLDDQGNECEESGRRMCEALTGYAKWKKTSYNTRMGVYYKVDSDEPHEDQSNAYRLNFAQQGMKYDEVLDGFVVTDAIQQKRVPRMILNPKTGFLALPKPEVEYPKDLQLDEYPLEEYREPWFWDENKYEWVKLKKNEPQQLHHFLYDRMI